MSTPPSHSVSTIQHHAQECQRCNAAYDVLSFTDKGAVEVLFYRYLINEFRNRCLVENQELPREWETKKLEVQKQLADETSQMPHDLLFTCHQIVHCALQDRSIRILNSDHSKL
ncbi:MAG: hypothetical protein JSS60_00425 [Verrucomicrobia bacterium]|nr:hypothetical protein [Verrucomicrobiota bacterium]